MSRPVGSKNLEVTVKNERWVALIDLVDQVIRKNKMEGTHTPTKASKRACLFMRLANIEVKRIAQIFGMAPEDLYKHYGDVLEHGQELVRFELLCTAYERCHESDPMLGLMLKMFVEPHLDKPSAETKVIEEAFVDSPARETREQWLERKKGNAA